MKLPCRSVDADLFFPDPSDTEAVERAKALCGTCPNQRGCAKQALDEHQEYGVWGGLSEDDRTAIWVGVSPVKRSYHDIVVERRAKVVRLHKAGFGTSHIASVVGAKVCVVQADLIRVRRAKIRDTYPTRWARVAAGCDGKKTWLDDGERDEVIDALDNGSRTVHQICRITGLGYRTVYRRREARAACGVRLVAA